MDKYIYDESNGLWYELHGDYYIPCLTLAAEKEHKPIGLWGQRHKRYLQEHKRAVYITLLASGKLNSYLADIDRQAQRMFFVLTPCQDLKLCIGRKSILMKYRQLLGWGYGGSTIL